MKKQIVVLVSGLLLTSAFGFATAATCRAGLAAAQGAQQGHERDMNAAAEEAKKNMEWADMLKQCVGGIANLSVTNAFPSLDELVNQQINKICYPVRSKISSVTGAMTGQVSSQISDMTGKMIQVSPGYTGGAAPSSSDIWKTIWR